MDFQAPRTLCYYLNYNIKYIFSSFFNKYYLLNKQSNSNKDIMRIQKSQKNKQTKNQQQTNEITISTDVSKMHNNRTMLFFILKQANNGKCYTSRGSLGHMPV